MRLERLSSEALWVKDCRLLAALEVTLAADDVCN